MKKLFFIYLMLLLSSCVTKTIAKKCEPTVTGEFWVCDSYLWQSQK